MSKTEKMARLIWWEWGGGSDGHCSECPPKNWGTKCSHWKYNLPLSRKLARIKG